MSGHTTYAQDHAGSVYGLANGGQQSAAYEWVFGFAGGPLIVLAILCCALCVRGNRGHNYHYEN